MLATPGRAANGAFGRGAQPAGVSEDIVQTQLESMQHAVDAELTPCEAFGI